MAVRVESIQLGLKLTPSYNVSMKNTADGVLSIGPGNYDNFATKFRMDGQGNFYKVVPDGLTLYPEFSCRAWANFDGATATRRGFGNLSVSRYGQGGYQFTFLTPMPDANYAVLCLGSDNSSTTSFPPNSSIGAPYNLTTTGFGIRMLLNTDDLGGSSTDKTLSFLAVFR